MVPEDLYDIFKTVAEADDRKVSAALRVAMVNYVRDAAKSAEQSQMDADSMANSPFREMVRRVTG